MLVDSRLHSHRFGHVYCSEAVDESSLAAPWDLLLASASVSTEEACHLESFPASALQAKHSWLQYHRTVESMRL